MHNPFEREQLLLIVCNKEIANEIKKNFLLLSKEIIH